MTTVSNLAGGQCNSGVRREIDCGVRKDKVPVVVKKLMTYFFVFLLGTQKGMYVMNRRCEWLLRLIFVHENVYIF